MIISLNFLSFTAKADFIQNALTIKQTVEDVVGRVKDGIKQAKTVISTAKSAAAFAKDLKNQELSNIASNLSGIAIQQIGDTVTTSLGIRRDTFTNPFTNGAQVVTDLGGFLKSNAENSVRSVLSEQENLSSTNPYVSTAIKSAVKNLRSQASEQIVVRLPFIAQKEICNSDKLKNVIKNGEPKTWINPKTALKNVDIDQLCNTNLSSEEDSSSDNVNNDTYNVKLWNLPIKDGSAPESIVSLNRFLIDQGYLSGAPVSKFDTSTANAINAFQTEQGLDQTGEIDALTQAAIYKVENSKKAISGKAAQAAFIAIAKAGYGGNLTNIALSDPLNTPSGVLGSLQAQINKKSSEAINNATNEYNSNGGIIGSQVCLDADGKPKKFDSTDPNKAFCDKLATSASSSAAVVKANLDAARQAPYLNLLAKASVPETSDSQQCSGRSGFENTLCDISNSSKSVNSFMDVLKSIIGTGGSPDEALTNNTYAQLATSLDDLSNTTKSGSFLSDAASQADKEYILGQTATATADQIPIVIDLYKEARKINTEKLNTMVYTYVMIEAALGYSGIPVGDFKKIIGDNLTKTGVLNFYTSTAGGLIKQNLEGWKDAVNTQKAATAFNTGFDALSKDIRSLIKQMAYNNYKEQQLNKLLIKLQDANVRPQDNIAAISSALSDTITDEEIGQINIDWNYASEYVSSQNRPSIDDTSSALFIPKIDEISSPFSKSGLSDLRLRAYQMTKKYYASSPCLTVTNFVGFKLFKSQSCIDATSTKGLLDGFGITSISKLIPDLPRFSYTNLVKADESYTYSELAYCEKIGVDLCDTKNLTILKNVVNDAVFKLTNDATMTSYNKSVTEICENPKTEIENYCTSTEGSALEACKTPASISQLQERFVEDNCY